MTTQFFVANFAAKEVSYAPQLDVIAHVWGQSDANHGSSKIDEEAQAVLREVQSYWKLYQQDVPAADDADMIEGADTPELSAGSGQDQGSFQVRDFPCLSRYYDPNELAAFLGALFDSNGGYGQAFHENCEILWGDLAPRAHKVPQLLWVRAEYIRIRKYLEFIPDRHIIITGQPGIGKSWMLRYLLVMRLRQRLPVLISYSSTHCHLYDEGKVYEIENQVIQNRQYLLASSTFEPLLENLWILIDSVHHELVPEWVREPDLTSKLIYASSPAYSRWGKVLNQLGTKPRVIVMNPYSEAEARLLATLAAITYTRSSSASAEERVQRVHEYLKRSDRYYSYSPSPRSFISGVGDLPKEDGYDELKAFQEASVEMAQRFNGPELRGILTSKTTIDMGPSYNSHKVILISRDQAYVNLDQKTPTIVPFQIRLLNSLVKDTLRNRMEEEQRYHADGLYKLLRKESKSKSVAGVIYEYALHRKWKNDKHITLEVQEPTRSSKPRPLTSPRYHFTFTKPANEPDRIKIEVTEAQLEPIPQSVGELEDNVLYYPEKSNQPGVDLLVRNGKTIYGLQVTIASSHTINKELHRLLKGWGIFDPKPEYCYVHIFVKDEKEDLTVPCPTNPPFQGTFDFPLYMAICPIESIGQGT